MLQKKSATSVCDNPCGTCGIKVCIANATNVQIVEFVNAKHKIFEVSCFKLMLAYNETNTCSCSNHLMRLVHRDQLF